jgi:hypothetical protein
MTMTTTTKSKNLSTSSTTIGCCPVTTLILPMTDGHNSRRHQDGLTTTATVVILPDHPNSNTHSGDLPRSTQGGLCLMMMMMTMATMMLYSSRRHFVP